MLATAQAEAAEMAGVTRRTYIRWEVANPNLRTSNCTGCTAVTKSSIPSLDY